MMYGKDKAMAKGGMSKAKPMATGTPAKPPVPKNKIVSAVRPTGMSKGGAVKKGMAKGGMVKKGKC